MNKYVAIITQPMMTNYGCLLQNWALQQTINKLGYSAITFDQSEWYPPLAVRIKMEIKKLFTLCRPNAFEQFITKNINITSKAYLISDFKKFERKYKPYAYVVGSDQVWRQQYNRLLDASFLSFTDCDRKVAYAASFGTDDWQFDEKQTTVYSQLIRGFKGVGVREQSAINLCKDYWGVDVALVLDPTLLLTAEEYTPLFCKLDKNKYVFTYILDSECWKMNLVKDFCANKQISEEAGMYNFEGGISRQMSVEQWITSIKQSEFVVCDSFHGTVFSILMHRPFLVLGNSNRGNTRLLSILDILGLKNRFIMESENVDIYNLPSINWTDVDQRITKLRVESINFLSNALK